VTSAIGNTPYNTNVMMAPSTVPLLLVASATAIITTTYNQAIGTRYMDMLI
jgi:hypothetical protein